MQNCHLEREVKRIADWEKSIKKAKVRIGLTVVSFEKKKKKKKKRKKIVSFLSYCTVSSVATFV
jgi:predicted membrane-bound mannosyltransferase